MVKHKPGIKFSKWTAWKLRAEIRLNLKFGTTEIFNNIPERPKKKSLFDFRLIVNDRKWPLKQKDVLSSEKTPVGILINYNCKFYFSKW